MINTKLVSSSVALLLMAVPLATPPPSRAAQPKPVSLDQSEARVAFVQEQERAADLIEKQFPRVKPEPPPPPPPPPAPKPVSPYAVRVVPVVHTPYNVTAVTMIYPGARNHFYYGYCTWYVATRRYVPWFGNASAWVWNAIAYGYRTGALPVVGAIMAQGNHVAFVERINGDGSFTVSEMNWWGTPGGGWGRVSYRTLRPGAMTFIY